MLEPLIYLASPYSDPNSEVKTKRWRDIVEIATDIVRLNYHVFCPIAHSREVGLLLDTHSFAYWENIDKHFIRLSTCVVVAKLDGWVTSPGVTEEMRYAQAMGKPVYLYEPIHDNLEALLSYTI